MYARPVYYSLFLWLLTNLALNAQPSALFLRQLTTADGLSSNSINDIVQDKDGFLWIATSHGLNRYDGAEIKKYLAGNRPDELPNNIIHRLIQMDSTHIAIATDQGLSILNTFNGAFRNKMFHFDTLWEAYDNQILFMEKDCNENYWIGTPVAVYRLDKDLKLEKKFRSDYTLNDIGNRRIHYVYRIIPLSTGEVMVWLDSGLHLWTPKIDSLIRVGEQPLGKWSFLANSSFDQCTHVFDRYLVYINHFNQKIVIIDEQTGQKGFCSLPEIAHFEGDIINNISELNDGRILLSFLTNGFALCRLETGNGELSIIVDTTLYFPDRNFRYGICDREGNWWFTSFAQGISKVSSDKQLFFKIELKDDRTKKLSHSEVISFYRVSNKIFIASYGDGFYIWNPKTGLLEHHSIKYGSRSENMVWNFSLQGQDTLWLGTQQGLLWYNLKTEELGRLIERHPQVLDSMPITTQFTDSHHLVWMGLGFGRGVCVYNEMNKTFQVFPNAEGGYPFRYPIGIAEDKNSNLWFVSDASAHLVKWVRNENRFIKVLLPLFEGKTNNTTGKIYLDKKKNVLWYGVLNIGLVCYHIQSGMIETYGIEQGLNTNWIVSIEADKNGVLWLATKEGISSFNPATKRFINYSVRDGLPATYSCTALGYDTISGQMLAGGWGNVIYFSPQKFKMNESPLLARLTGVKINNQPYLLPKDQHLNLSWKDNDISLAFTAINLTDGQNNKYAYQLGGNNTEWIELGNQRQIRFASLNPGDYTFTVKAARRDGRWSPFTDSIQFTIRPPFVKTIWFYLLTLLIIAGLIYGWYRYRLGNMLRMEKMRARISHDLHDDIGSRLTNISLMSLIALQNERKLPGKESLLEKIQEESRAISHSMREIVWNIDPENDSLEEVMPRMLHFATGILENKNIMVKASLADLNDIKLNMEERRDLFLIFKEAIHNIVRHSGAQHAFLSTEKVNNVLILQIIDDGKGFDIAASSSGHGLTNMKHRANKHHWNIQENSKSNEGTQIILEIKIT